MIFLYFQDKLPAFLRIYRDTLITVMKASIKAIVAELLLVLTARPIDSDSVTGDRAADGDGIISHPFTISFQSSISYVKTFLSF